MLNLHLEATTTSSACTSGGQATYFSQSIGYSYSPTPTIFAALTGWTQNALSTTSISYGLRYSITNVAVSSSGFSFEIINW